MAGPESKAVWKRHEKHLWPSVRAYYGEPLALVEGDGLVVRDADGNEYLDFFGGILTVSVGHRNPTVNRAIKEQLDRITHTSTLYPSLPMVELAERLARLAPGDLEATFFTASGTDADETAVMLAQVFTGRQEIVALRHCYSGRSFMARALTAHAPWRMVSTQLSFFKHAHAPYCYRCDFGLEYPSCDIKCARDIETLIQTTTVGTIAGFIAEPIQGVGGFVTPPKEYFEVAVGIIEQYGGLFICDEVQTGFARTGGRMWGIQHYGVQPDIMTVAKGIANGLPLGAAITRPQIAESMTGMTVSTFGGNPVSCAAATATLKVIEGEGFLERVERLGNRLRDGLEDLQRDFPQVIGEVRGRGLMLALELVVDETVGDRTPNAGATAELLEATRERGLLLGRGGLHSNVLRIAPPMTVDEGQIDDALEILAESLQAITA